MKPRMHNLFSSTDFVNLVTKYVHTQKQDPSLEIEFRFSTKTRGFQGFVNQVKPSNFRFMPSVFKHNFLLLLQALSDYQYETIDSKDTFLENHVRISTKGAEQIIMKKTRSQFHDWYPWNVRICMCKEEILENVPTQTQVLYERHKHRTRFHVTPCLFVDMTIVTTNGDDQEHYEVELEYVGQNHDEHEIGQIVKLCQEIYSQLQATEFPVSYGELFNVSTEYKTLTKTPYFIGALPDALHLDNTRMIKHNKDHYHVTVKLDGERKLLFFSDNASVYAISRNMGITFTGITSSEFKGTIMDAEYMDDSGTYHVFDVLYFQGTDLRGKQNAPLPYRVRLIETICKKVAHKKLVSKQHQDLSSFDTSLLNHDNVDGLIFTPVNEPYPTGRRWTSQLKWKSKHTVDLATQRHNGQIYVYGSKGQGNNGQLFFCGELRNFPQFLHMTDAIVECVFNGESFDFIKVRCDKKYPNSKPVLDDAFKAQASPINLTDIFSTTQLCHGLRKAHGQIKRTLFQNAAADKKSIRVLELGCGQGGDLYKWDSLGIPVTWVGVDLHQNLIDIAKERIRSRPLKNVKVQFVCGNAASLAKFGQKFDIVSCQFAIHHLFSDIATVNSFLEMVSTNLKTGGSFLVTTLDATAVISLLKGTNAFSNSVFELSSDQDISTLVKQCTRSFGAQIQVMFHDPTFITNLYTIPEYLVFPDVLLQQCQAYQLVCTETQQFSPSGLSPEEMQYSELNRWYVFKRVSKSRKKLSICEYGKKTFQQPLDCNWDTVVFYLGIFLGYSPLKCDSFGTLSLDEKMTTLKKMYPAHVFSILTAKSHNMYIPIECEGNLDTIFNDYNHIYLTEQGNILFDGSSISHDPPDWVQVSSQEPLSRKCLESQITFKGTPLNSLSEQDIGELTKVTCPLANMIVEWYRSKKMCRSGAVSCVKHHFV